MYCFLIFLVIYSLLLVLKRIRKQSNLEDPEYFYYSVFLSGRQILVIEMLILSGNCSSYFDKAISVGNYAMFANLFS